MPLELCHNMEKTQPTKFNFVAQLVAPRHLTANSSCQRISNCVCHLLCHVFMWNSPQQNPVDGERKS